MILRAIPHDAVPAIRDPMLTAPASAADASVGCPRSTIPTAMTQDSMPSDEGDPSLQVGEHAQAPSTSSTAADAETVGEITGDTTESCGLPKIEPSVLASESGDGGTEEPGTKRTSRPTSATPVAWVKWNSWPQTLAKLRLLRQRTGTTPHRSAPHARLVAHYRRAWTAARLATSSTGSA